MGLLKQDSKGMAKGLRTVINTEPTSEPVTTTEFKSFAKIDYTTDDTLIGELITAARKWVEDYIGRKVINTTVTAFWTSYAIDMSLPFPPHSSITHVKTVYLGDTTTLTEGSDYYVYGDVDYLVRFTTIYDAYSLEVKYVAGYGADATSVPKTIKYAIMKLVLNMYEQRNDFIEPGHVQVPFDVRALLQPYRIFF